MGNPTTASSTLHGPEGRAFRAALKRSQFIVGMVRALRGLQSDLRVTIWLLRRGRQIKAYLRHHNIRRLQLATSNNVMHGWLNTDVFINHRSVVYMDATARFPFEDNTFSYIMAEHMIEHIEPQAAEVMLNECFRVLRPGGRIRIAPLRHRISGRMILIPRIIRLLRNQVILALVG